MNDRQAQAVADGCGALIGRLGCLTITVAGGTAIVILIMRAMGVAI